MTGSWSLDCRRLNTSRRCLLLSPCNDTKWRASIVMDSLKKKKSVITTQCVGCVKTIPSVNKNNSPVVGCRLVWRTGGKKANANEEARRVIFNGLMVFLIEKHACLPRWRFHSDKLALLALLVLLVLLVRACVISYFLPFVFAQRIKSQKVIWKKKIFLRL